ncbi:MAG: 16S rRNA (cytosine(1402)-N(4))-methyltransferase RsmH [Proteobacteria bacterium]|nr:16S rRNA (cytosine(1402)-N(4))-methyltransferase RsmH [Pseudomonadota bacterium]
MHSGGEWQHTTVLLAEAIESLLTTPDGVYVDGTFGRGGHSRALLARLSPRGRLIAFDRDPEAVAAARSTIVDARFAIEHAPFSELKQRLAARGVPAIDGLLLDLGVSSPQIDNPARGFSFRHDAPLDMRMDPTRGESAADFLARAEERHIAEVIREHGEERFAVPIAKALVARRESGNPVRTTGQLSEVVARAVKTREPGQDPATRTFQGLRIHVNAELEELEQGLKSGVELLKPTGRLVVISFHSLEDRIVKTFIARESRSEVDRRAPFAPEKPHRLKALARIKPSEAEVRANPRSRSAVMRVAERTEALA